MMKNHSKRGQAWSIDLIIGLLVFVLIVVIFYALLAGPKESKIKHLTDKADVTAQKLFEEGLVDPVTNEFDDEEFLRLAEEDYEGLRERLGIVGDFCLFLETNDDPPVLKIVVNGSYVGWTGIGSSLLNVSGFNCSQRWPP